MLEFIKQLCTIWHKFWLVCSTNQNLIKISQEDADGYVAVLANLRISPSHPVYHFICGVNFR